MKKTFILVLVLFCFLLTTAQQVYISDRTTVVASDNVFIHFNDVSVVNDGSLESSNSSFYFTGTKDTYIGGHGKFLFNDLRIDKENNTGLLLASDIEVAGKLQFTKGSLNIRN